jgi:hypothetical protein
VPNIETAHPIAWELKSTIEGQSSQTLFAAKATAEREAANIHSSYGSHAFTRISPVTIRLGWAAP